MDGTAVMKGLFSRDQGRRCEETEAVRADGRLSLLNAEIGHTYIIREIDTTDEEMNAFLFRLGCYSGEPITLISRKRKSCVVAIKDSRYGLDNQLAEAVIV